MISDEDIYDLTSFVKGIGRLLIMANPCSNLLNTGSGDFSCCVEAFVGITFECRRFFESQAGLPAGSGLGARMIFSHFYRFSGMAVMTKGILEKGHGIEWPALIPGTLMKRYKRFLADVHLKDGGRVTAHCPNSGTMKACAAPGRPVYLSYHDTPKRKLKYTWEMIDMPDSLVGVNTLIPNRLVKKSIENGLVDELKGYGQVFSEVKVGQGSRLDLMLRKTNGECCFVEVKNCTLVEGKTAYFPDAVTARGRKHLLELQRLASQGNRCVMFFLIQRMDAERFRPADHIDSAYGEELRKAYKNGVEILVYDVTIDLKGIALNRKVPLIMPVKGVEPRQRAHSLPRLGCLRP